MTSELVALCIDANDPPALARFWGGLLRREVADDGTSLLPNDDTGFRIRFLPTDEPKTEPKIIDPGDAARAPSDAIVLFDGKDLSSWASVNGGGPAV